MDYRLGWCTATKVRSFVIWVNGTFHAPISTSLLPKPFPASGSLKRKMCVMVSLRSICDYTLLCELSRHASPSANSKKQKKSQISKSATTNALDLNDRVALNRRAERFKREHEIEQQKSRAGGGQASLKANHNTAHLFNAPTHPRSASPFANLDDLEADPVSLACTAFIDLLFIGIHVWGRMCRTGIDTLLSGHPKKHSKIICD